MSLKAGIVGLPNVGKSTLFNAVVSAVVFSILNLAFVVEKMLRVSRFGLYFFVIGMLEIEELGKTGPLLVFCVSLFDNEILFGGQEK